MLVNCMLMAVDTGFRHTKASPRGTASLGPFLLQARHRSAAAKPNWTAISIMRISDRLKNSSRGFKNSR